ncbi:hypothetical protein [Mycoplasma seminis]|uniref:BspA family leucine-rich repeat surface protein n=1 Tax=Mycoplasma seminis TaxID=512749 RepID=A0ABY9HAN1_9MOLU|nr:hypothetical protein [Mycoplasma seminis]WLP85659.1 hypothetical protein Q8852_00660 [Mycoplasma seminis]
MAELTEYEIKEIENLISDIESSCFDVESICKKHKYTNFSQYNSKLESYSNKTKQNIDSIKNEMKNSNYRTWADIRNFNNKNIEMSNQFSNLSNEIDKLIKRELPTLEVNYSMSFQEICLEDMELEKQFPMYETKFPEDPKLKEPERILIKDRENDRWAWLVDGEVREDIEDVNLYETTVIPPKKEQEEIQIIVDDDDNDDEDEINIELSEASEEGQKEIDENPVEEISEDSGDGEINEDWDDDVDAETDLLEEDFISGRTYYHEYKKKEELIDKGNGLFETENFVTTLEDSDFIYPDITKLRLSNVSKISPNAFKNCPNLELIIISRAIDTFTRKSFEHLKEDCIIAFEYSEKFINSFLSNRKILDGKKVIFGYKTGDENNPNIVPYVNQNKEQKKIIISKNTPLDNDDIKELFLKRNSKYGFTLEEINSAISVTGNNLDKNAIIENALFIKLSNGLATKNINSFNSALWYIISKNKGSDKNIEFLLLVLFSGMNKININKSFDDSYKDYVRLDKYWLQQLNELLKINNISQKQWINILKESKYFNEFVNTYDKEIFTFEQSVKLISKALKKPSKNFYVYKHIKKGNK